MRTHRLSVLSILAAAFLGGPAMSLPSPWDEMLVKHKWNAIPDNWVTLGHPPDGMTIDLHIALKPHRENALIDALYEVSEPGHPKYGAHLSKEQVAELVAPHPDTLEAVSSWLEYHSIPSSSILTTHGGSWLTVAGVPVSRADELLGASYRLYYHAETNDTILRTIGYALPAALHTHVQTVAPTTAFASMRPLQRTPWSRSGGAAAAAQANATSGEPVKVLSRREDYVSSSFLRWLYHTSAYVPAATDQNELGIVGYKNEYPSQEDLTAFMDAYRVDATSATFTVVQVNGGGNDPSHPGTEANLDTQYAAAIAYPTPHIYYSVGGKVHVSPSGEPSPGDGYLEWLNYVLRQPKIPQTISISYGTSERAIPREYAMTVCNLFAQLGARGVSVLFASSDDGVGRGDCKDDSGRVQFSVVFPASCPWVTSVGGTMKEGAETEVAMSLSGGGFSDHFPRPNYQSRRVSSFLDLLGDKYTGLYNAGGRGVPDIAVYSWKYVILWDSKTVLVTGTSCSTPRRASSRYSTTICSQKTSARSASFIPGCTAPAGQATTTSHLVLIQAAALTDFPPSTDGILSPA